MTAVVYLRRQDLYMESFYREIIRNEAGAVMPFSYERMVEHFGTDIFDYANLIRFLEQTFDNVVVRPFQRSSFLDGDLFRDFCHAIGAPWNDAFDVPAKKVNRAPDARLAVILNECNERLPREWGKARRVKEILEELGRLYFETPEDSFFDQEQRTAFLKRFEEGNAWIAEKYGIGHDGALFDTSDIANRGTPKSLTLHDAIMLQLYVNQTWLDGLGAVPFPVYNYKKIKYLERKRTRVRALRRGIVEIQILMHRLLHAVRRVLPVRRWEDGLAEATAMNYVMKNITLFAEAKQDYLGND
jgi:hypothetical protein